MKSMKTKNKVRLQRTLRASAWTLSTAAILSAIAVGCADQRPTEVVQGFGVDVRPISDLVGTDASGKSCTITTTSSREATPFDDIKIKTRAAEAHINAPSKGIQSLGLVNYTSDCTYLGDIPLLGKPNSTYEVRMLLTEKWLKLYKVAKPSDVPHQELGMADTTVKTDAGKVAIPLVGYPIESYYRLERVRNADREETNQLLPVIEVNRARASHVKINFNARKAYDAVIRNDVFPGELFEFGEDYYYAETIIDASVGFKDEIGNMYLTMDSNFGFAPKVRFRASKNGSFIEAINASLAQEVSLDDEVNAIPVIKIPVEWKAYRTAPDGRDTGMSEEEARCKGQKGCKWVQIDFDKVQTQTNDGRESELVDLEVTDTYLGFTLLRRATDSSGLMMGNNGGASPTVRVKYSFYKVGKRPYAALNRARRSFEKDRDVFGFFVTQRPFLMDYKVYRQEDIERNVLLSRFDTSSGKIVFNFSKNSPTWARPIGRKAVAEWNEAFEKAGVKAAITLDESHDVSLGDVRYNIINLIDSPGGSNLFGFGPSISDPSTGEIVSATANVHINPVREALVREVRTFIERESGLLSAEGIVTPELLSVMFDAGKNSSQKTDALLRATRLPLPLLKGLGGDLGRIGQTLELSKESSTPQWKGLSSFKFETGKGLVQKEITKSTPAASNMPNWQTLRDERSWINSCHDNSISRKYIEREIREQCAGVVEFAHRLKNVTDDRDRLDALSNEELSLIVPCAEKLAPAKILSTLIHEMGHNLGLRHNFLGSFDKENFLSTRETGTSDPVRSSSIMEYTAFDEDRLVKAGNYDVAAIRFGYGDAVETEDGKIVKIRTDRALENQGVKLKNYLFCTDEDTVLGTKGPECLRFDAGTTPDEIVTHMISEFQKTMETLGTRRDRYTLANEEALAQYQLLSQMIPIRRFYDEWRFHLAQFVNVAENGYLENYNEASLKKIFSQMAQDTRFGSKFRLYRPAAERAYQFFKEISAMPNRYCVLGTTPDATGAQSIDAVELDRVREEIYKQQNVSVKSCRDPIAQSYFAATGQTVIDEVGRHLLTIRYSLNLEDHKAPLDVVGTIQTRANAKLMLSLRAALSLRHLNLNLFPNFYDEPGFRTELFNEELGRVFNGQTLAGEDYKAEALDRFKSEEVLLRTSAQLLTQGLMVPGRTNVTSARLTPFFSTRFKTAEEVKLNKAIDAIAVGNGYLAVMSPAWQVTQLVIKKIREIDERLTNPGNPANLPGIRQYVETQVPDAATAQTATLGAVLGIAQNLQQIAQAIPLLQSSEAFMEILGALSEFSKAAQAKAATMGIDSQEKLDALLAKPVAELELKNPVSREALLPVVAELEKVLPAAVADYQRALRDRTDLEAQKEILLGLVL